MPRIAPTQKSGVDELTICVGQAYNSPISFATFSGASSANTKTDAVSTNYRVISCFCLEPWQLARNNEVHLMFTALYR